MDFINPSSPPSTLPDEVEEESSDKVKSTVFSNAVESLFNLVGSNSGKAGILGDADLEKILKEVFLKSSLLVY